MRKLALAALFLLASNAAARAPVQAPATGPNLTGKVVRISGDIEGLGIVKAYERGAFIALLSLDEKAERQIRLIGRYKIALLAEAEDKYRELAAKGLIEEKIVEESAAPAIIEKAIVSPSGTPSLPSLPATHLAAVARDRKITRIVSGAVELLIGGLALAVSGKGDEESRSATLLLGGGLSLVGLKNLLIRSGAERANERVMRIEDPQVRDRAEGEALSRLAVGGLLRRVLSGSLWLGAAVVAFSLPSADVTSEMAEMNRTMRYLIGLPCLWRASDAFFKKSAEENHWKQYQDARKTAGLTWDLGLAPARRGVAVVFTCVF